MFAKDLLRKIDENPNRQATHLAAAIKQTEHLIELKQKALELMRELHDTLVVWHAVVSQHPEIKANDIRGFGYRAPKRGQYAKWSKYARSRLPWVAPLNKNTACLYRGRRVVNVVWLKSGEELELRDPLFLDGAPWGKFLQTWVRSDEFDSYLSDRMQVKLLQEKNLNSQEDLEELRRRNQEGSRP